MTTGTGTGGSGTGSGSGGGSGGTGPGRAVLAVGWHVAYGVSVLLIEIARRWPRRSR